MFGLPLAFAAPAVLAASGRPRRALFSACASRRRVPVKRYFPPLRLLIGLNPTETTPARTPWPILALRLAIGALIILAMAEPLWNSLAALSGSGPLLVLIDDGFAAAPDLGQADRFRAGTSGGGGAVWPNRRGRGPLAGRPGHRAAGQIRG